VEEGGVVGELGMDVGGEGEEVGELDGRTDGDVEGVEEDVLEDLERDTLERGRGGRGGGHGLSRAWRIGGDIYSSTERR
jgi:hypothetical protein